MAAKEIAKGKIICQEGSSLEGIHIIVNGSVKAHFSGGDIVLKKGDIVGLIDIAYDSNFFTYTTLETCSFVSFPIKDEKSIPGLVKQNPEVARMMFTSMINQVSLIFARYSVSKTACEELYNRIIGCYKDYNALCAHNNTIAKSLPGIQSIQPLNLERSVRDWLPSYYYSIREFAPELKTSLATKVPFLVGFLYKSSADAHSIFKSCTELSEYHAENVSILLQESRLDLFDLYTNLLYRLGPGVQDFDKVSEKIDSIIEFIRQDPYISNEFVELRVAEYETKRRTLKSTSQQTSDASIEAVSSELNNALDTILEYSGVEESVAANFRSLIEQYKKLKDKGSSEDKARSIRHNLTKAFYDIYCDAFSMSIRDYNMPTVLKMFFNFGFVDAELAGIQNANTLYRLAVDYHGDANLGVYTIYEWLLEIYAMKKEPSRNELDSDFNDYLHEQRVQGKITIQDEQRLLQDPGERTMFELQNMFQSVNRVTYGRLSTFCPVFCEADVIKPLGTCLVTPDIIVDALSKLEEIDYSAFYRDTMYPYTMDGNKLNEIISVRIQPDFILFPNIGTRGVMWQEIEGKKRTTPARFMLSIFHIEDLQTTITRLVGEYRWDMCKRVQGARWNDITERSLTSEYCDYAQFFKKNSDLSADAKEKVKVALQRARNSFKEMYVRDYIVWIVFEGSGSPRLNKVARTIFCTYCPFPKMLRDRVAVNPMYGEIIDKYNIKNQQKLHRLNNIITKMSASGQDIPQAFEDQIKFINGTV